MIITIIAGARPNFMKVAPIIHEIKKRENINFRLIHTGQHYDKNLSDTFFKELNIPYPHVNFNVGSGTQSEQTGAIMVAFEKELETNPTDVVLVVGDVTSTMSCSIVAKKTNTKLVHVEGGIRSFDLTMPEEINRMVTDSISDYFYVTSEVAVNNLLDIGKNKSQIVFVGNTMIDTLIANMDKLRQPKIWNTLKLKPNNYIVMTMHRPANVDEQNKLKEFLFEISENAKNNPVIFPIHPRTKNILNKLNISYHNIHFIEPLGYLEFNYLVKNAKCVITDSGGITEETTYLGIPCLTLRDNTERPETVDVGTNFLVGTNPKAISENLKSILNNRWKKGEIPQLWDGKTSERIVNHLLKIQI